MTENEAKAVRFIKYIKKYAAETLDHIAKEDIIASTVTYTRKKEKAETILAMVEELEKYRAIGTLEECRAAVEKQTAKKVKSISQVKDGDSYVGLIGRCPCCGDILEEDTVYCDCGQRLDWGTSDEID